MLYQGTNAEYIYDSLAFCTPQLIHSGSLVIDWKYYELSFENVKNLLYGTEHLKKSEFWLHRIGIQVASYSINHFSKRELYSKVYNVTIGAPDYEAFLLHFRFHLNRALNDLQVSLFLCTANTDWIAQVDPENRFQQDDCIVSETSKLRPRL